MKNLENQRCQRKERKHLHHPTTYIEMALLSEMRGKKINSTKTPSIHRRVYARLL